MKSGKRETFLPKLIKHKMVHQVFVVPWCFSPASSASSLSRVWVPWGPSSLMSGSSAPAPRPLSDSGSGDITHNKYKHNTSASRHQTTHTERQKIYIFVNKTWNIIQNYTLRKYDWNKLNSRNPWSQMFSDNNNGGLLRSRSQSHPKSHYPELDAISKIVNHV